MQARADSKAQQIRSTSFKRVRRPDPDDSKLSDSFQTAPQSYRCAHQAMAASRSGWLHVRLIEIRIVGLRSRDSGSESPSLTTDEDALPLDLFRSKEVTEKQRQQRQDCFGDHEVENEIQGVAKLVGGGFVNFEDGLVIFGCDISCLGGW
jgi:hypothetical protein